ncbi:MAG: hypothetical protein N2247_05125 [Leptospiraceae bacterium]|jgi:hypothetical protein|nr:hypothetical protein [Leptospiraceae bacterium]
MIGKTYYSTGKRETYNKLLRHMVFTTTIVDRFEKGENLANILNEMLDQGLITKEQIPAILRLILVERAKLPSESINLNYDFYNFSILSKTFQKWNALDVVIAYYHPTYGLVVINPANQDHWDRVHELKKDELLTVYVRSKKGNQEIAKKAIDAFFMLLENKIPEEDLDFILPEERKIEEKPEVKLEPPQPQPSPTIPKSRNITPKYSVQVTNELFHNGNVEAWKNIIEAYEAKYPDCKVIVYHEGELIQDLNSLFKWGKVKHGGVIMFQVIGENIKGVSRLQKYLHEGASPRFESFLKKDVNKVLNLF